MLSGHWVACLEYGRVSGGLVGGGQWRLGGVEGGVEGRRHLGMDHEGGEVPPEVHLLGTGPQSGTLFNRELTEKMSNWE